MLARNSTLQSMKKEAARLQACTIVLSKVNYPDKNLPTTITDK